LVGVFARLLSRSFPQLFLHTPLNFSPRPSLAGGKLNVDFSEPANWQSFVILISSSISPARYYTSRLSSGNLYKARVRSCKKSQKNQLRRIQQK
jgi:hypothetical protein